MKIYASRADDLKAKRSALIDEIRENNAKSRAEEEAYDKAEDELFDPIIDAVKKMFSNYPSLDAEVKGQFSFGSKATIKIYVNERNLHDDSSALAWNYQISLDPNTGEVSKESGSWSGLKATTEEQLDSLRQTLSALEDLQKMDWTRLLNVKRPKYSDFVKTGRRNESQEVGQLDSEILEAEIEDIMGQNVAVKTGNFPGSVTGATRDRNEKRGYFYITFDRETPSQYQITEYRRTDGDNGDFSKGYTHRVKKSSVLKGIFVPLETVNF